jgi:long-chain acyl-CoA synthetase
MAEAAARPIDAQSTTHIWEKSYPPGVNWHVPVPQGSMVELFDGAVAKFGARPCIDFLDKKYTYAEAGDLVNRIARGLQDMGVKKGDKVGLFLPNTPYSVIFYFGIMKAGGTVVNFNPLYAEREIEHMIADSETDIMVTLDLKVTFDKLAKMIGRTRLRTIIACPMASILPFPKNLLFPFVKKKEIADTSVVGQHLKPYKALIANAGNPVPVPVAPLDDVAVLQYTGGTTGVPKGAMLTHGNLSANSHQAALWFPGAEEGAERMLAVLPFFHVFAMTGCMNWPILKGAEIIMLPRFELDQVLQTIQKKRPTLFPAVPTIYTAINNHQDRDKYDLSSIKFCISGGAPLPVEVKAEFEKVTGCKLVEGYGLSESSPVATTNPVGGVSKPGSIGLPLPGTLIEIMSLEDRTQPVTRGERGEICIRGPQVMKGYWKKQEETANTLVDGRLHTGYTFIVDRIKDMILAGGYNVYPRNVEEAIYQHQAVAEVIVLGVPDPYRGQTVKAYIKVREGATLTVEELKSFLADKLSPIEMPKLYEFRAELPKTMIGKLSRKALLDEMAAAEKEKATA